MAANTYKYTAQEIARAIGKKHTLTAEQVAAVEQASVDSPSLVVAGAGSGKTELMSIRVPWLVANGFALPEQILGLTFTRKAAAELGKRVFDSLIALRDDGRYWPFKDEAGNVIQDFTPPNISTYNSYANSIFRDFALQLGYEADAIQLTEATQFQFAKNLLNRRGTELVPELADFDFNTATLVDKVISLAAAMNDNVIEPGQVEEYLAEAYEHLQTLPKKDGETFTSYNAYHVELMEKFKETSLIARLASEFLAAKLREGRIDYSDQVALAAKAVREIPEVVARERNNYTQILLDEYQDTSFLQTQMLSGLFRDSAVFAVGDPNQSIYGWRGASASNLSEFANDFSSKPVEQFQLSTSWRNPRQVLELANVLASPLSQPASYLSEDQKKIVASLEVVTLKAAEYAGDGVIDMAFEQDMLTEAKTVAKWFAKKLAHPSPNNDGSQTAALLLRKRANIKLFMEALQAEDLEVEVVGLGGLLEMPEIADIKCALSVMVRPDSGTELIRLLAGARWRIGAKDIDGLYRYARWLASSNKELREVEGSADESSVSLVDALDRLASPHADHKISISDEGLERMKDAAKVFRAMRERLGLPLTELVRAVAAELWIDIELMANPSRKHPLIHINEFVAVVSGFLAGNNTPTVSMLLDYLEYAAQRESLEAPRAKPQNKVIQILTVHGAKGLEWDYVAIPNLVENDFPSKPRSFNGWLESGKLPYALRGDAKTLPEFDVLAHYSQNAVNKAQDYFKKEEVREMLGSEERRLIYVAITRPKHELLLTGSYWKPGVKTAAEPSRFLRECLNAAVQINGEVSELTAEVQPIQPELDEWPKQPFADTRKEKVMLGRQSFEQADPNDSVMRDSATSTLIERLLLEREVKNEQAKSVDFGVRVSASNFKAYLDELDELAGSVLRPIPQQPYAASRMGNLFHAWVEKRFAPSGVLFDDELDELEDADDFIAIETLQQNFEQSR
ncbi:MAG: ATP-dependent helicase, partial [Micrococcales bacterium]